MPVRAYYRAPIFNFLQEDSDRVLGALASRHHHTLEEQQKWAWMEQVRILKASLRGIRGHLFLEFAIPRMGKRADAVLVIGPHILVVEFKVGASRHGSSAYEQVVDYALDLKNFHEGSHDAPIIPILVSTDAASSSHVVPVFEADLVASPIGTNSENFGVLLHQLASASTFPHIDVDSWSAKGYRPTPTIIEAARVLYETHSVVEISRSEAEENLHKTAESLDQIINHARRMRRKSIAFVTGVPGSGKTLAGLNFATRRSDEHKDEHAVFLSGNGPLVTVLREALSRDKARRESVTKKAAEREVGSFVQNIHHFRDEYLSNPDVPLEKVVIFDEAQRAWTRTQAASFMKRKRGQSSFNMSEPEFLISVMDRHLDWCTIVCLVGEGQEINTGEAGISEWMSALQDRFGGWSVYASPHISRNQDGWSSSVCELIASERIQWDEHLHLAVSVRSFRAETLSEFIRLIIDGDSTAARHLSQDIKAEYPIVLTRDLSVARAWLRRQARGTERMGLVASSGAIRLRPEGIHIKAGIDPANWFLNGRMDIRSSYYLEDVASQFEVQGLELDWVGVCWDGDFHQSNGSWAYQTFEGTKWRFVKDPSRQRFLRNAYRVLLTRARQGMVIFVPKGDVSDPTRPPWMYEGTAEFLQLCGVPVLD